MRNLVTIQRITKIEPIEGADRIETASVLGWKCVVNKGEFKEGDLCVYFEVDSFLPVVPMFDFLRNGSFKSTRWQGDGFRIRTQKLRGQISQGLILPVSAIEEIGDTFTDRKPEIKEGEDVTDVFGVTKYDPPEYATSNGKLKGGIPYGIYHTDEIRVQSVPEVIEELKGKPYFITTKMDGTSVTMYAKDGKFGITGHNREFVPDDSCLFYKYAKAHGIPEKILSLGKNVAFQGEFCGPGFQGNRIGLKEHEWYVFNIEDIDTLTFYDYKDFADTCDRLGIQRVPLDEIGNSFNYTLDELIEKADGKYGTGRVREGIVIRPQKEEYSKALDGRLSFKVLNNRYLLKNG